MLKTSVAAAAFAALIAVPALAAAPTGHLQVVERIAGPDGGWDYASFDPDHRRVYVAHGDRVIEIDADTGKANPVFAPGDHLHEVLGIPGTNLVLTTNSGDKTVRIYDTAGAQKASLTVADDADGAFYDPATKLAVVINGDPGLLTLVGPKVAKVVATIKLPGKLEFGASDGKGHAYVAVEDKDSVAEVDLRARKVLAVHPLEGCKAPGGLAYVSGGRVIAACHNNVAEIMDAASGRKVANLQIGGFPDAVIYDPARNLAFIPTALDGKLNVIALSGAQNNTITERVPTQMGARTGAVDPKTGRIYLPSAEYLPPQPGKRPQPKPGTFNILVLDRR